MAVTKTRIVKGKSPRVRLLVLVLACCVVPLVSMRAIAATVQFNITGSTQVLPLLNLWIPDYAAANPNVTIVARGTGSSAGLEAMISGTAEIGVSDIHMSDEEAERNPQILNIPLAISAQTINFNLPGMGDAALKLNGPTLAAIYSGTVREWDAPAIRALNPGLALAHRGIIPIHRADASGNTFIFTLFLDFSTPSWDYKTGYGTTIPWPNVPGEMTAVGNEGMVQTVAATPYSIGYIGISFEDEVAAAHLGTAMIENQNGKFLLPTAETIGAAAAVLDPRTPPDERLSLVYAPGDNSYPLVYYEYALVSARQSNPEDARALRDFLRWAGSLVGGNGPKYLDSLHFIPLPDFIRALNEKQIGKIQASPASGENKRLTFW